MTLSCSQIAYFRCLPFVAALNWQKTTLPCSYSHTRLLHSRCSSKNKGAAFFFPHFEHCVFEHTSVPTQWPGSSDSRNPWGNHRLQPSLSIHSQSPDLTWKCFHGMPRGNWGNYYLAKEDYSTFLPLLSLSGPSEGECHIHGYWVGEDKDENAVSCRPCGVPFCGYKRKNSPTRLGEKSALTLLQVPALI